MTDQVKTKDGRYFGNVKKVVKIWNLNDRTDVFEYDIHRNDISDPYNQAYRIIDIEGKLIFECIDDTDFNCYDFKRETYYIYDIYSRLIETVKNERDWQIGTIMEDFDEDEVIDSCSTFRTRYVYDDDDLLIEEIVYDKDFEETRDHTEYEYNDKKLLIKQIIQKGDEETINEHFYNENGDRIKSISIINGKLEKTEMFAYNKQRQVERKIITEYNYKDDPTVPEPYNTEIYEYNNFDCYGNARKIKETSDYGSVYEHTCKFTYYKKNPK